LRNFTLQKRNKVQREYRSSGFVVLRTPLLPIDEFLRWGAGFRAAESPDQLAQTLAEDRNILRSRLKAVFSRPEIREALFLASPDFVDSLPVWLQNPESKRGQRVERALVRYFSRMVARATSFGLFAGISVGEIGSETQIVLAERERYERHTRLDMNYLARLSASLADDPVFKSSLLYRPNPTLYPAAERFHYFEERIVEGYRSYHLVAVDPANEFTAALNRAREGARFSELTQTLLSTGAPSLAWANEYIEELIDAQVLVGDLGASITGTDPLRQLIAEFKAHPNANNVTAVLNQALSQIKAIDASGLGVPAERYHAVVKTLDELAPFVEVNQHFQVDLIKPVQHAQISNDLLDEIIGGVELLQQLAAHNTAMDEFCRRFQARYGLKEVPLVEALDENLGVGFDFNTLRDVVQRETAPPEGLLFKKVYEAVQTGATEIALGAGELSSLARAHSQQFPIAVTANVVIIRNRHANARPDDYWFEIKDVIGPSGANLMARFCNENNSLRLLVDQHLRAEEELRADAAFAEIVYLPENRMANILCRPVLRSFEIPYLGRSGAPPERQIPVTDLLISLSSQRLVLRSRSLECEVLPRLTSAHNFLLEQNLSTYQFLCLLQRQQTTVWSGWDWGALESLNYLPRVTAGRLILARARWNLVKDELISFSRPQGMERYRRVQQWRRRWKLPRYAALIDDARELLVDFDNVLSIDTFVESIKKQNRATLVESFVTDPDQLLVTGPEGRYVSDVIIPLVRTSKPDRELPIAAPIRVSNTDRKFPPGSEWLYVKLYAGKSSVDRILRVIGPTIEHAVDSGAVDRWFFLRAADPFSQLCLYFHGNPTVLRHQIQEPLQEAVGNLLHAGTLWRIQIDTYEREFEKYGGLEGMALAEAVFQADSETVMSLMSVYPGSTETSPRWYLTLRGVDQLLSDFGLDTPAKYKFVDFRLQVSSQTYTLDLKRQLGQRYRKERRIIEQLLVLSLSDAGLFTEGLLAFQRRTETLKQLAERYKLLEIEGRLLLPLPELIAAFALMHICRLLKSDEKIQQVRIYDCLRRYYGFVLARDKRYTETSGA